MGLTPRRIDEVLALLDPVELSRSIGRSHDQARESYRLREIIARDSAHFQDLVAEYVRHHLRMTSGDAPDIPGASGLGRGILNSLFPAGLLPDGYTAALATGCAIRGGNMPEVVAVLAEALKGRAIQDHVSAVFHERVDILSRADREDLEHAIRTRFEKRLTILGACWDEAVRLAGSSAVVEVTKKALEILLTRRIRFQAG